jgi:hypothetical protein
MAQLELVCRWSVDFVELLVNVNLCPAFVEQRVSAWLIWRLVHGTVVDGRLSVVRDAVDWR